MGNQVGLGERVDDGAPTERHDGAFAKRLGHLGSFERTIVLLAVLAEDLGDRPVTRHDPTVGVDESRSEDASDPLAKACLAGRGRTDQHQVRLSRVGCAIDHEPSRRSDSAAVVRLAGIAAR